MGGFAGLDSAYFLRVYVAFLFPVWATQARHVAVMLMRTASALSIDCLQTVKFLKSETLDLILHK